MTLISNGNLHYLERHLKTKRLGNTFMSYFFYFLLLEKKSYFSLKINIMGITL
jgi:hypothetical protein